MRDILADLVASGSTCNRNRHHCSRVSLLEERSERLQEERLEPGSSVRDIRLHLEFTYQVNNLTVQCECTAQIGLSTIDLKDKVPRADDAVANLRRSLDRRKRIGRRRSGLIVRLAVGALRFHS